MKRSLYLLLILLTLTSCSYLDFYKKNEISNNEISSTILIDDYFKLNSYLSSGISPNLEINKEPLIDVALKYNSINSLKLLITRGANVDALYYGKSPLYYVRSLKALEILIDNGAFIPHDLFAYYIKNKPISYIKLIITKNDFNSWNNIMIAIKSKNPKIISLMKENGFKFNILDENLNYPVYYVDNENMILALLDSATYNINLINRDKENVLGMVLLKSAKYGYLKVIYKLVSMGVDINYMAYSQNALDIASIYNPTAKHFIEKLINK